MSKEVQISIKMAPELRAQLMAVAANRHRPAAQIIREMSLPIWYNWSFFGNFNPRSWT
ncbi:MAG: hypothetical protein ACYCSS_04340 [Sulfuriferula sp.]